MQKQLKNLENEIQMQSEDLEPNYFNFQDLFEEFVGLPTKTFYCTNIKCTNIPMVNPIIYGVND